MNFLHYLDALSMRLGKYFHYAVFLLFKKPLYLLSYNTHGNKFVCHGLMSRCSIKVIGGGNEVIIDQGVRLNNVRIAVSGRNNKLILHRGVVFKEGGRIRIEDEGNLIELGENGSFINCFFSASDYGCKIIVGKDSLFSNRIIVRTSDSHSILNEVGQRINHGHDVIIGDRVWVAYGVTILKKSVIEDDCVIGTQSVVAGAHIPKGCIAAGNPARVVKEGVHWRKERLKK